MSAAVTMHMAGFVSRAFVRRCATDRDSIAYFDEMFVHVSIVHVCRCRHEGNRYGRHDEPPCAAAGSMVVVVIVMLWCVHSAM